MPTHASARRRLTQVVSVLALTVSMVLAGSPGAWALPANAPQSTASFNDVVRAVVYAGDTIYVGGGFTSATDSTGVHVRNHVAALDSTTGRLLPWNPGADAAVWSLAVAGGNVYLGGDFSTVGGAARRRLAKVSATTGAVAGSFVHTANRNVRAMAVLGGSLYVGGAFTSLDGQARGRLAGFDLASGALLGAWEPQADSTVFTLAGDVGRIYVGGKFTDVDGQASSGFLTAVSPDTAAPVTGFTPSISYAVHDLAVTDTVVYAAADGPGGHLRAFELNGDNRWDLPTDGGVQAVTELGGTVYFGGHFDQVCSAARSGTGSCQAGLVSRRKLGAATANGNLTAWAPQGNSSLGVTALDSAAAPERIAVGGAFTQFARKFTQPHFAQFR